MSIKEEQTLSKNSLFFDYSSDYDVIFNFIKNYQCDKNCDTVELKDIPTIENALNLICNPKFKEILFNKFPLFISLKLKILHEVSAKNFDKINVREKILITFESTENNLKIFCWKNSTDEKLQKLVIDKNITDSISNYAHDFISDRLKKGEKVLMKSQFQSLPNLIDSSGYDLLMSAIEQQNLQIINQLLKFSFDLSRKTNENLTAADIAWNKNDQETLLQLLKKDSVYPKNFSTNYLNKEIKSFMKIRENLEDAVTQNDLPKIREIISFNENKNLQRFYDTNNKSIITFALENKNIDMYEFLLENNLISGPFESNEIFSALDDDELKAQVRKINSEYSKNIYEFCIHKLLANSVIFHDNDNFSTQELSQHIKEAYYDINAAEIGQLLLETISTCEDIKIHFDFNRKSIMTMDPFQDSSTDGASYYTKNHIYIGAKEFLDDDTRDLAIGILKHEICHLAMQLIFRNNARPYGIDDDGNREKFEEISKLCKKLKKNEKIIESVYECYDENLQHAELAVRVPHMIGCYQNNQKKLTELKGIFSLLFKYFDEIIKPAMIFSIQILKKISKRKLKFDELTEPLKSAISNSSVYFQGHEIEFKKIVNYEGLNQLEAQEIFKMLNYETLIIGNKIAKIENYIERNFSYESDEKTEENQNIRKVLTYEEIVTELEVSRLFLISDHAGTGKSTTCKYFASKLKENFINHFICYVDLKQYLALYKNSVENFDLLEILKKFAELDDDLDERIFLHLYKQNQIILLLDGIDEISPKYNSFILNFIKKIKEETKIKQIIATRPIFCENFKHLFGAKAYEMEKFNVKQEFEFIRTILGLEDFSHPVIGISAYIMDLGLQNNPLMMKMFIENYSNGNFYATNLNQFSFYEQMIKNKMEILATEKGPLANFDSTIESKVSIWEIHQIYAVKFFYYEGIELYSMGNEIIHFGNFNLFKKWLKEKAKWTPEAISRFGFLVYKNNMLSFVHRTFAEYFVTKFLFDTLKEALEDEDDLTEKEFELRMKLLMYNIQEYCNLKHHSSNTLLMTFIEDYLKIQQHSVILGKRFLKYLRKKKVKKFIRNIFNEFANGFVPFVMNCLKFFNFNKAIIDLLLMYENNSPTLLRRIVNYDCKQDVFFSPRDNSFFEIIKLYNFLIQTNLPTGYESKRLRKPKIETKEQEFQKNLLPNFLIFITETENFPVKDLKYFLIKHFNKIFNYGLRSQTIFDLILKIYSKFFYKNEKEFERLFKNWFDSSIVYCNITNENDNIIASDLEHISIGSFSIGTKPIHMHSVRIPKKFKERLFYIIKEMNLENMRKYLESCFKEFKWKLEEGEKFEFFDF
ncbi:hypothetical protein PVAND_015828 [Polypedilum vanderplanki]|uniref:NACHT domain-containing protein n=1 Tax=Polypedilum vanderplanki TaxID=319348 RepID=A0A9J6BEC1_POLVA|nr:hypothetical protein PVAND_015828 [Polypedilum vanderplanki]